MKGHKVIKVNENKVEDLFYEYRVGAKPFLKWVGGKRQLLSQFETLYPTELKERKIKNYYEPFVGGGAVFFDVAQNYEVDNAFLYDINDELILSYKVIQKDVHKLLEFLTKYDKIYKILSEKKQQEYYYELRNSYNLNRFNIDYEKYSENWIPRVDAKRSINSDEVNYKKLSVTTSVGLSVPIFFSRKKRAKKGFPLLSLTQNYLHK